MRIKHPVQPSFNLSVAASICCLWNTFFKVARPSFQSLLNIQYAAKSTQGQGTFNNIILCNKFLLNKFCVRMFPYQQSRSHMVHPSPACLLLLCSSFLIPYSARQPACSQASERPTSYTSLHHYINDWAFLLHNTTSQRIS